MKALTALLTASLFAAAFVAAFVAAQAQENTPPPAAPADPAPGAPADQSLQLAPPSLPGSATDNSLIPTTPETTAKGPHEVQTSGFVKPVFTQKLPHLSRTEDSEVNTQLLIRFREGKSKAVLDPDVQAAWHASEIAHTDYERRLALQHYYGLLYDRMAKLGGCFPAYDALNKDPKTLAALSDKDDNEIANMLKAPKSNPELARILLIEKNPGSYPVLLANTRHISIARVTQVKLIPDIPPAYLQPVAAKSANH